MDVALIYPNKYTSSIEEGNKIPPLGLAYIAAVLEEGGYSVKIYDLNLEPDTLLSMYREIADEKPKFVGITVLTPFHSKSIEIAHIIKEISPTSKIVAGGAHATAVPQELLDSGVIDIAVKGEGEIAMFNLMEGIYLSHIPESPFIYDIGTYVQDLDTLPYPARHLLKLEKYNSVQLKGKKVTSILSSRGCPYSCTFCDYRFIMGSKFRRRSAENFVDEIEYCIKNYNIDHFTFRDSTFTFDPIWINAFTWHVINRGLKFTYDCNGRVNLVTDDMIWCLKKTGCNLVSYGIESGCQRVLDMVNKKITVKQSIEAIKLTKSYGIETLGYFILGLPTDTKESIKDTIGLAKKLNCDYTQFSLATPFPNTPMYDYAVEHDLIKKGVTWDDFSPINKSIMRTEELDFSDLEKALKLAYRSYYIRPKYIMKRLFNLKPSNIKQNLNGLKTLIKQQKQK